MFFGSMSSWILFVIFLVLGLVLILKFRYAIALLFPVFLFVGLSYITYDVTGTLVWQGVLYWVAALFLAVASIAGSDVNN
jgi:hypothetical protein